MNQKEAIVTLNFRGEIMRMSEEEYHLFLQTLPEWYN
jgi:hypothetical protein